MIKKVLWIDDSPKDLAYIVAPVVKKLWKKEVKSDMYIAGDFEKENSNMGYSTFCQSIEQLNGIIASEFVNYLIENDFINNIDDSKQRYTLINDGDNQETKQLSIPTSNIASTNIKGISIPDDTMEAWKKINEKIFITINDSGNEQIDYSKVFKNLEDNKLIGDSIKNIIDNIKGKSYDAIFIDMCLLKDDYKKLSDKNSVEYKYDYMIPIFSMALYNTAKKSGLNAYMYTSYTTVENYVAYWKETYKLIFSNGTDQEEIDFYNRKGKNIGKDESLYKKVIKDLKLKENSD